MKEAVLSVLMAGSFVAAIAQENGVLPAETRPIVGNVVARAQFTTAIVDREPANKVSSVTSDVDQVYFFTELRGLNGQTVTHRWELNDKVMSEMHFTVGAARWRVFSRKKLDPRWLGNWKVSVLDQDGGTLGVSTFTYRSREARGGSSR